MSLYKPQEATCKLTIEKMDQERISGAYPEMSLGSPTNGLTDWRWKPKEERALCLINISIIILCLSMAEKCWNQPCPNYSDFSLESTLTT